MDNIFILQRYNRNNNNTIFQGIRSDNTQFTVYLLKSPNHIDINNNNNYNISIFYQGFYYYIRIVFYLENNNNNALWENFNFNNNNFPFRNFDIPETVYRILVTLIRG